MPKTLLLADDSITIQKVVGITFAGEDFRVTTVDNGEDAIARARELKPDVILADVVMPRKNGYEVCQAVKSDPALQHIPVLLLAGTFEAFDERRAQSVRADGHIAKPFESQALITKVKELLSGAPVQPAAAQPTAPAAAQPAPVVAQRPAAPTPARPSTAAPPAAARPAPAAPSPRPPPGAPPVGRPP
ncbi:MAG: response regulator, partial [Anaeromyxobacteraceae bacterium]